MELVLGLAALATAISGATGAGHYDNAPEIKEAEPTTHETAHFGDQTFLGDFEGPSSHIGDFGGVGKIDIDLGNLVSKINRDESEPNNTLQKASAIRGLNNDYSFSSAGVPSVQTGVIYAKIGTENDFDWFKFIVFGKAKVEMTLSRPSGTDYRIGDLQKKVDSDQEYLHSTSTDSPLQTESVSLNGALTTANLENINPGVYYVKIESPQKRISSTEYSLSVKITYDRKDLCISDYASLGAKAAIWVSDYDPFGLKPNTAGEEKQVAYGGSENNATWWVDTSFPLSLEQPRKQAELFIWDNQYKQCLKTFASALKNSVQGYFSNHGNKKNLSFVTRVGYGAHSGGANVIMYSKDYFWGTKKKLAEWNLDGCVSAVRFSSIILPKMAVFDTKDYLYDYLDALYEDVNRSGSQDIIRIPVHYSVNYRRQFTVGGDGTSTTYYYFYLGYRPEIQGSYIYDLDTIYACDYEGGNPISGTVYPLTMAHDDVDLALNRVNRYNLETEGLLLNETSNTFKLAQYESKWFSFTAPKTGFFRIRSNGDSYATLHVHSQVNMDIYNSGDAFIDSAYQTPGYENGFSYDFHLNEGETLFFRVCGKETDYTYLNNTNVTVTEIQESKFASFQANDLPLANSWDSAWRLEDVSGVNGLSQIQTKSAYNSGDDLVEMQAEIPGTCFKSIFRLFFNRPVKTIAFGYCLPDGYSYAYLPLYVEAHDEGGDVLATDLIAPYSNDYYERADGHWMYRYGLQYATSERDVGADVYAITFSLDPATDQSPYHISHQRGWLCDFFVEYAD